MVITLGAGGCLVAERGAQPLLLPAPRVQAVDTTGAGDSLAAGMLADLSQGRDMSQALATGVRVASTVVGRSSRDRYPAREELLPPAMTTSRSS